MLGYDVELQGIKMVLSYDIYRGRALGWGERPWV